MGHLKAEDVLQWLRSAPGGLDREGLLHLLSCAECRARALAELQVRHAGGDLADVLQYPARAAAAGSRPPAQLADEDTLTARFGRAYAHALASADHEQRHADRLFLELAAHPAPRREVLVRNSERFRSLALAQRVLEASRETCFDDARESERLARLALAIVDSVDAAYYGRRLLDDLRARALAHLGNALRLANDLDGAERAFAEGLEAIADTSDPAEEAGFLHLLASLRKHQRRFGEAADLLHQAAGLYEDVGDGERLARTLTSLGSQYLDQGCAAEAEQALLEAMRHVDPLADPRTALYVHHNLTLCMTESGRFLEAQRLFRAARKLYDQFPDRVTRLRERWLEGILAAGTGQGEQAEEILGRVQADFTAAELPYDAALVGLERAALCAREGRTADLKRLVEGVAPVFFSYRLHRDGTAAVALLLQAAQREQASLDLVREVAGFLKRARHDPDARFRPGRQLG